MSAAPFTMAMDFAPEDSHHTFHGTVTITKATLTVSKTNSSAATAMRDPATNERSSFIGVCSLPLIQFYRNKNAITLTRGSSYLFDNAAVSAGLKGSDASIHRGSSRRDNPSMWTSLQMRCDSLRDCDRVVEALLSRNAEETFQAPRHASRSRSEAGSAEGESRHRHHSSTRQDSTRGPTPRDAKVDSRLSSPRSSRLPSRRENDDATTISSARSSVTDVATPRSARVHSRRGVEEATPVAMSTPSQSIRSAQQRVAPGRAPAHDSPSRNHHTANITNHHHRSNSSARSSSTSSTHHHHRSSSGAGAERRHSSGRRQSAVDPTEREFTSTTRPRSNGHAHRSSSSARRHESPRGHYSTHAQTMEQSVDSLSPRSTTSRRNKSELEFFVRSVQKLQHHRLHFMQYLHKEMVHQAFLAEEAKLKASMRSADSRQSPARHRSGSSAASSPARRTTEAEAARLAEIETRLAQVEALHREAEKERDDAARLRREYEWRAEELNARLGSHPMADGSRGVSVNSSVTGLHNQRQSVSYGNGQLMVVSQHGANGSSTYPVMAHPGFGGGSAEWALINDPAAAPRPDDVDLGTAIIDRYVFGEEWGRVFPSFEADVRFNAQIDVCLAMKLPRRLVMITNVVVDKPGLRVTAEIRYDRVRMERDAVERRMQGCPFRFLQRFYDMRDLYDPANIGTAALTSRHGGRSGPKAITAGGGGKSNRSFSSRHRGHSSRRRNGNDGDEVSEVSDLDADDLRDRYEGRVEDRVRAAEDRMARRRARHRTDLHRQLEDNAAALMEEESYRRDGIDFGEARARQALGQERRSRGKETLATSLADLQGEERVARAAMEVGAARQLHVLMGGHRRLTALLQLQQSEKERRKQILAQAQQDRGDLTTMMHPALEEQRKVQDRRARGAALRANHDRLDNAAVSAALAELVSDEVADRAVIRSQAMAELLDVLYRSPAPSSSRHGRRPSSLTSSMQNPSTVRALLREVVADEANERVQFVADEQRRRQLYRQDEQVRCETVARVALEEAEMDARDGIVERMLMTNRAQLERRLADRERMAGLLHEEQFYRRTILSDEQDGFEVLMEMFAAELKEILARAPTPAAEEELDARRRRVSSVRMAKPFHYMTFSPEDMDYAPSAVLALEGMMGCAINKNLEVVSVDRPLPKTEESDMQLQAGDMILDVAGHSLHSLSHLREVLSNRAMQIQEEALVEFPDVPSADVTTNPALQKYLEVLCEHHNFLVQVLRGCDIYQIIVRS